MATHDIIVVTFGPDAEWTKYLLRSIKKYARGFRHTVLVYPDRDHDLFKEISAPFPFVVLRPVPEPVGNGHRHQMFLKMSADSFSNADYFHHLDSDCELTGILRPEDVMTEGRPDLIYTHYSEITGTPWQVITENTLGFACPVETMRRFPFIYPRWLYPTLRKHIAERHQVSFESWVFNAPCLGAAWHGISEFNALGAFAREKFASRFHLYDSKHGLKSINILQQWSHYARCTSESDVIQWERAQTQLQRITDGWETA